MLEKVKKIVTLPNTNLMTTKMVADYYEVSPWVIRKILEREGDLFEEDCFLLSGQDLVLFKIKHQISSRARNLRLFNIKGVFIFSFLIKKSRVSMTVREEIVRSQSLSLLYTKSWLSWITHT